MIKHLLPTAILGLTLLAPQLTAEEAVEIKMRWEPGATYLYSQTVSGNSRAMGQETTFTMDLAMNGTAKKHEKGSEVVFGFSSFKMKMGSGGNIMVDADSDNPESLDGLAGVMFKDLLKAKATVLYDGNGKFLEVTETENIAENSPLSPDQFEQTADFAGPFLPEKAVKVGETWKNEKKMPIAGMGVLDTKLEMTLNKIEEVGGSKIAFITYTGSMSGTVNQGQAMEVSTDSYAGEVQFDLDFGTTRLLTNKAITKMSMKGMEEPISVKSDTSLKLNEVKLAE